VTPIPCDSRSPLGFGGYRHCQLPAGHDGLLCESGNVSWPRKTLGTTTIPAERAVRGECPRAAVEVREHRNGGWIVVVTHDGVEYAGSGATAAKAWADAASNLGIDVPFAEERTRVTSSRVTSSSADD